MMSTIRKLGPHGSALLASLVWLVLLFNWWFVWLRFESPRLNHLFVAGLLFMPLPILILASWEPKSVKRSIALATAATSCIFSLPILLVALLVPGIVQEDGYCEFKRVSSLSTGASEVVTYRTGCGATTQYGIEIREERPLFLGIKRVRRLHRAYPAEAASLERVGPSRVLCHIAYAHGSGVELQLELHD